MSESENGNPPLPGRARADTALSGDLQIDFRGLLEAAPDAMIIVDRRGRVLLVNQQVERLFGYSRDELIGQDVEIFVPERFRSTHPSKRDGYFARPKTRPMGAGLDLFALRKDGREFPAEISLSPLESAAGTLVTAAVRDISDRKRLEELRRESLEAENRRIQEANRLKSEFLANMSHELRTPLNAIIGFAELMYDGRVGPVSEDHREYLGDILTSSRHLLQLINDVLDLAKVEAGKMEFHPEPVELGRLIGEVSDVLRTLAARKRIHLHVELDPRVEGVVIDPAKLKQVLYNYLSNAIKFTPDGGHVTVRTLHEHAKAFRIEVEDTGIGMKPEELHLLFQEFKQLDAGTAKKFQGTGLGLSLTRRIVEAQGGRVGVRSTYGTGSIFSAVLPKVSAVRIEPMTLEPVVNVRPGAPTILMVEDDPADRVWLMGMLLDLGYNVQPAVSGREASEQIERRAFDAITLDLILPDTSGWEVLKAIRASSLNHSTPTLVVTLVAEQGVGAVHPIQEFLVKPVQSGEISRALQRAGVSPGGDRPILIVDDDPATRKLLEVTLEQAGYRTLSRSDGRSGLEAAAEQPLAAIVLDLLMPEVDGFEFLDRLRPTVTGASVPVIVWTSKTLDHEERARLERAAQALVSKGAGGTSSLMAQLRLYLPGGAPWAADGAPAAPERDDQPGRGGRHGR